MASIFRAAGFDPAPSALAAGAQVPRAQWLYRGSAAAAAVLGLRVVGRVDRLTAPPFVVLDGARRALVTRAPDRAGARQ
jgi:hypothetical protein